MGTTKIYKTFQYPVGEYMHNIHNFVCTNKPAKIQ